MLSFFEIQPGLLINLALVKSLTVTWDRAVLAYTDGTDQTVPFGEYTTARFSPHEVQKRLKALGQTAEHAIYA